MFSRNTIKTDNTYYDIIKLSMNSENIATADSIVDP